MATCDPYIYTFSKNCPYPTYGYKIPTSSSSPTLSHEIHISLFHHLLGTSKVAELLNTLLIIVIVVAAFIFIILPLLRILLGVIHFKRLHERPLVFLELTPPAVTTKTPEATMQFYTALHGLLSALTRTEHMLKRRHIVSLEVVNTRSEGIRFIVPIAPEDVDQFQHLLASYLPTIHFRQVKDYIPKELDPKDLGIVEFKQSGNFAYSLALPDTLSQHDPIAYIAGAMVKPLPSEIVAFQLVITPASRREAERVRAKLLKGQDAGMKRKWWHYPFIIVFGIVKVAFKIVGSILRAIWDEISGVREVYDPNKSAYIPPPISAFTQHRLDSVQAKLDQPLFNVSIRALVIGDNNGQRLGELVNSLYTSHVPGYQGLVSKKSFPKKYTLPYRINAFRLRLPTAIESSAPILAADEVAALYHFPYGSTSNTEDMVKSLTTTLPAPLAMKRHSDNQDYDVILGENNHHGSETTIGLTAKEREKHVYVIGGTGNGKTTMLEYAVVQDIKAGKGVAFIDPHGDAAQRLLKYIPKSRINDVVYLNPRDIKYPIGLNLLELPEGLDEDELLLEKERVAEAAISVLRKVFADDNANAHRIEAMFRNAIHTAFSVEGATLFTVLKLIRNTEYRNAVISKLDDDYLKDFWQEEFGKAGNMQRVSMSKGLTHRIDRFRSSQPVYRMLSQAKSTINFEDIIDSGKILICNFTTDMGEDTSTLFGTAILAKLKTAAERRSRQPEETRRPFYVYVDEFQNFATTPFVKMLSASRKYKLYLTVAEQSTAQQEELRLTEAILANVSTIVCFSLGSPADEELLLGRFEPWIKQGNLMNLAAYNFYMRVKAEEPMEPVSGETIVLPKESAIAERAEEVISASRDNYAIKYVKPKPAKTENSKSTTQKRSKAPTVKAVNIKSMKHRKS